MQSVKFFSDVQNSLGAPGYSILQTQYNSEWKRIMTLLILRDVDGITKSCVIAPAETLREVIL
jgi:hypothetical protein